MLFNYLYLKHNTITENVSLYVFVFSFDNILMRNFVLLKSFMIIDQRVKGVQRGAPAKTWVNLKEG